VTRKIFSNPVNPVIATALILSGTVISASGCSSQARTGEDALYPSVYEKAIEADTDLELTADQQRVRDKFRNFEVLFADFKQPDLRPLVESVYAKDLYFNDTLHTFSSREPMLTYMQSTADRVNYTRVKINDIVQSGDDYYVRWSMDNGFSVLGKDIDTHSIGMTHIRFDEFGQINFHQDFWDNTEGLFRHLPVVGYFISKIKNRL